MTNEIKVLHIDTEKCWRGGQQQAAYLFQYMHDSGYQTVLVCQPRSAFEKFCTDKALPHLSIRMNGEIDFTAGFRIAQFCRKNKFDILHLHSAHALSIGLWAKFFYNKLKLIAVRRVDFHIKKNRFSHFKYKNKFLDKIVCISDRIKKVLLEDGIPEEKLTTIHSGIDIHKFENVSPPEDFKKKLGIPQNHILIGTVAAIVGHKDYPNLLKAARIVINKMDNVTFCAVGDGSGKDKIVQMANKLELDKRFIFTGFRKDVGNFLKSYDIFVLASKMEGLGTSILDAQAVGLPVVGCKTGGIPEVVLNNKNGILVPPQDPQKLADVILSLINDPAKMKEFSKSAIEDVKQFDIKETIKNNLQLYEKLTNEFKKILVIQTAFIGDVILSTGFIRELKKGFPDAKIDLITTPISSKLFSSNPYLKRIYSFDKKGIRGVLNFYKLVRELRSNSYDAAFSLHLSTRSSLIIKKSGIPVRIGNPRMSWLTHPIKVPKGLHMIDRYIGLLKPFVEFYPDSETELHLSKKETEKSEQIVLNDEKFKIGIAPGSIWETKKWPSEYFAELVSHLKKYNISLYFIGSKEDFDLSEKIISENSDFCKNFAGKLSLLESAALIKKMDLMITNDSAPLHMANAVKTDVISFFGPTVKKFGCYPYRQNDIILEIDLDCRPCGTHGGKVCPENHFRCMREITPQKVLKSIKTYLEKK